jgi:hypothetical protein
VSVITRAPNAAVETEARSIVPVGFVDWRRFQATKVAWSD